jgi:proteic killer suppression protein
MWNCSLLRKVRVAQVIEFRSPQNVIESFGNRLAEGLFDDRRSKETRAFPAELLRAAHRKVLYLHDAAQLSDLRVPPGNRLEALKGRWKGFYSIRVYDQWRVAFRFESGNASDVRVVAYHLEKG